VTPKIVIPRYEDCEIHGLPWDAFVVTNSERSTLLCPRWNWFQYTENLRPLVTDRPLRIGSAWHLIMESVYRHWMAHDTEFDDAVWTDPLEKIESDWSEQSKVGLVPEDEWRTDVERLSRSMYGYIQYRGRAPSSKYRIVAVEQALCAPIMEKDTDNVFSPDAALMAEEYGFREARTGEGKDGRCSVIQKPYYYIGRADVIVLHRETGDAWVLDHKYTASPESYRTASLIDLQMPGYCWMLDWMLKNGHIDFSGSGRVGGYIFEATSSALARHPTFLKSGKISKAANARIASWNFIKFCEDNEIDVAPYAEYIESLKKRVDRTLYISDWTQITENDIVRCAKEAYGVARRISDLKWDAAFGDLSDINYSHPRLPLCKRPGSKCRYTTMCFSESAYSLGFEVGDGVRWITNPKFLSNDNNKLEEELGW